MGYTPELIGRPSARTAWSTQNAMFCVRWLTSECRVAKIWHGALPLATSAGSSPVAGKTVSCQAGQPTGIVAPWPVTGTSQLRSPGGRRDYPVRAAGRGAALL